MQKRAMFQERLACLPSHFCVRKASGCLYISHSYRLLNKTLTFLKGWALESRFSFGLLSSCFPTGKIVCAHLQFPRDSCPKIDSRNFYHQNIYFAHQPFCIQFVWCFTVSHLSKKSSHHLDGTCTAQLNVPTRASDL